MTIRERVPGSVCRLVAALCCLLMFVTALGSGASAAVPKTKPGLEILGMLEEPADSVPKWIVGTDEAKQRLYYIWRLGNRFYLREYDLRPDVPRFLREVLIGDYSELSLESASPYNLLIDQKRDRMLILAYTHGGSLVRIVDLNKLDVIGNWDLSTVAPGFLGMGMNYSEKDGRIYVVGNMMGHGSVDIDTNVFATKAATPTAVLALDADSSPTSQPKLSWARILPECQQVLNTRNVGALIARGSSQDALYFACARPEPWPGESGLVRIWIDPKADMTQAQEFKVDFFPVSGSYSNVNQDVGLLGTAVFDQATNRFFMHSVAVATPGTWVFDGDLSAWVGFIAAPDYHAQYIGLDPSTGHFYSGASQNLTEATKDDTSGYALVSDARGTPVPQGDIYGDMSFSSFVVVDPATHRLFVKAFPVHLGLKGKESRFVVLRDNTPETQPIRPPDYDALTADIPEGPETTTTYSGSINGYGARAILVGGYGGALSVAGDDVRIGELRPGDRGITTARVPSLDLRSVGASGTAQAYLPDSNTAAELQDGAGQQWPWGPATCLDGSGDGATMEQSQSGGEARVTCDLAKETVRATASSKAISAGDFAIGSSYFDSIVQRDPKKGIVAKAFAFAENLMITIPAGSLSIDRIEATAETVAHGRPKTNGAEWQRVLSGIEVRDGAGKVVQRVGECSSTAKQDDCAPVIQQINDLLKTRLHIDLPKPEKVITPKGAFAGVQQTDRDFYQNRTMNNQGATFAGESASRALPALQVTLLNDTRQKSRLVVQLAALQTGSIYTISPAPEFPTSPPIDVDAPVDVAKPSTGGGVSAAPDLSTGGDLSGADVPADAQPIPVATAAFERMTAFLPRTPQEAILFVGFWGLFGGAGWTVYRRRSLLSILNGVGR
jgi:hypothetical protein